MRICLIAPSGGRYPRLAELLSRDHEVTLIRADEVEPTAEMKRTVYAGDEHRRSAALTEAIREAYAEGGAGPDFVEIADRRAFGLVPLMARRCADPLLRRTRFAVRLFGTAELTSLHDGLFGDPDLRLLGELEREQLRLADRLLHAGGDAANLYRRYYGESLPAAFRAGLPGLPAEPTAAAPMSAEGELRILYSGELSRSGGALDLADACLRLPGDDWRLTMVGTDTETGPAGQSVQLTIEAMFDGDPRLSISSPEEAGETDWGEHDLLAVTPTFAVWSEPALEAMRHGLPVLATPVGQLPSLVEPGVSGWLAEGTGAEAIRRALLQLLDRPGQVAGVTTAAVIARYEELTDPERIRESYQRLLELEAAAQPQLSPGPTARSSAPLVSGVIPYHRGAAFIADAVRSLLGQTHRNVEAVIVNDGSFEPADAVLDGLAADPRVRVVTQLNRGETAARNLGARMARGEYVVMLDADNMLEPEFVARTLAVFEREPDLAYVSCWLRFVGPDGSLFHDPSGYAPLGNGVVRDDVNNWDGDTLALLPRRIFTELGLGFDESAVIYSDWELYRGLREAGQIGTVIPEHLARYRFLGSSLQRAHAREMQERGWNEARARRVLRATRWTADGDGD